MSRIKSTIQLTNTVIIRSLFLLTNRTIICNANGLLIECYFVNKTPTNLYLGQT